MDDDGFVDAGQRAEYIHLEATYILAPMSKHLVDLDEDALSVAQARLGTTTIKDTVNAALRRAGEDHETEVAAALDVLGSANLIDRSEAWR